MDPITLTAKQIKEIDEIQLEKSSLKDTLEVALCFYSNHLYEKEEARKKWWNEIFEVYRLDKTKNYKYQGGQIKLDEDKIKKGG